MIIVTQAMSEITSMMPVMMLQLNGVVRKDVRTFRGTVQMLHVDEENENAMHKRAAAVVIDPELFGFTLLGRVMCCSCCSAEALC